ncbi:MAG: hypothetical protein AAB368_14000, partial [bacterium]
MSAPVTFTVAPAPAALTVDQLQTPAAGSTLNPGDPLTYRIVVTNTGAATLEALDVLDTVTPLLVVGGTDAPAAFGAPAIAQDASGTVYGWSAAGLGMLPGASFTFTITGVAGAVCVETSAGNTAFAEGRRNCAAASALSAPAGFTIAGPVLGFTVSKTQTPAAPGIGEAVAYRLVVTNTGSIAIQDLDVVDTVSPVVTAQVAEGPAVFGPPA